MDQVKYKRSETGIDGREGKRERSYRERIIGGEGRRKRSAAG